MSYAPQDIQGAIDTTNETITQNSTVITAKGLTPTNIKNALTASSILLGQKDTVQENLKSALKLATDEAESQANATYDLFSSTIDMLIGAVGKKTPLAKQFVAIRKKLTKSKRGNGNGSSSSSSSGGGSSSSSSGDDSSSSSS
jgi:hypothetical protein